MFSWHITVFVTSLWTREFCFLNLFTLLVLEILPLPWRQNIMAPKYANTSPKPSISAFSHFIWDFVRNMFVFPEWWHEKKFCTRKKRWRMRNFQASKDSLFLHVPGHPFLRLSDFSWHLWLCLKKDNWPLPLWWPSKWVPRSVSPLG